MSQFKPLSEKRIRELLEGQEDLLTPLVKKEEAFFRSRSCPLCHGAAVPFVDEKRPFVPNNPLPNRRLRCSSCGAEFDPYSGLVTRVSAGSS